MIMNLRMITTKSMIHKGHLAPKGLREKKYFNKIVLPHDSELCYSRNTNSVYNIDVETEKLYTGSACAHTDKRFYTNSYSTERIKQSNSCLSLKSCIRTINRIKNIPIGTKVHISSDFVFEDYPKVIIGYDYVRAKNNNIDIKYNVDKEEFTRVFTKKHFSYAFCKLLRECGFLVKINTTSNTNQEYAIAYGHNKRVMFAEFDVPTFSHRGGEFILWNKIDCFNKYADCNVIPKNTPFYLILDLLTTENDRISELDLVYEYTHK